MDPVLRRLSQRAKDHQVDVNVGWPGHGPGHRVGNVVGRERLGHARVDGLSLCRVAAEAVQREFFGLDHSGRDLDHADGLAQQLEAQGPGESMLRVLGRHVATAALIGDEPGGGSITTMVPAPDATSLGSRA